MKFWECTSVLKTAVWTLSTITHVEVKTLPYVTNLENIQIVQPDVYIKPPI